MVVGLNHPKGPEAWEQEWTRARIVEILDTLWATEHDPRYRVSPASAAPDHRPAVAFPPRPDASLPHPAPSAVVPTHL